MMNVKILMASFGLVFLAELGDKTQLTALAFSSSSRSPFSVFLGTSLALVLSSAIAVLLGELLGRYLPPKVVQISAAVMFVLVGLTMLVNVARKAPAEPLPGRVDETASAPAGPGHGLVASFILKQAIRFEEDVVLGLREHAATLPDGPVRAAVTKLADAHGTHIDSLVSMSASYHRKPDDGAVTAAPPAPSATAPAPGDEALADEALAHLDLATPAGTGPEDRLAGTIEKQEAAARFYLALARIAHLHETRDTLRWLALEELRHTQELAALAQQPLEPAPPVS